ncbi:MAG: hypothetical protein RR640_02810, partial [Oscillospiraceae bacterium]
VNFTIFLIFFIFPMFNILKFNKLHQNIILNNNIQIKFISLDHNLVTKQPTHIFYKLNNKKYILTTLVPKFKEQLPCSINLLSGEYTFYTSNKNNISILYEENKNVEKYNYNFLIKKSKKLYFSDNFDLEYVILKSKQKGRVSLIVELNNIDITLVTLTIKNPIGYICFKFLEKNKYKFTIIGDGYFILVGSVYKKN